MAITTIPRFPQPSFTFEDPIDPDAKQLIDEILIVMQRYELNNDLNDVYSFYQSLSEDRLQLLGPIEPHFRTNRSLAPVKKFIDIILGNPTATLVPPPLTPPRRQTLIEALKAIKFSDLLDEIHRPNGWAGVLAIGCNSCAGGSRVIRKISEAINHENPIDGTFDLLRFVIEHLVDFSPQNVRETYEYKFLQDNHANILDIMQELAHLAKAVKKRSFEGYEVIELLAIGKNSSQIANHSPGAMIAKLINKCTLERPVRIFAWNLLNSGVNEFTSTRRITWPILKLILAPQVISTEARSHSGSNHLYPFMQKTLIKIANLADYALDKNILFLSIKFRDLCNQLRMIENSAKEADARCVEALQTFGPFIKKFHALIENSLTLSSAIKEEYTKKDGFQGRTACLDILRGKSFDEVSLPIITHNLISLIAEGMTFISQDQALSNSEPFEAITKTTRNIAICSAQLSLAKKINHLAVFLLAPPLMGILAGTITKIAPPLAPVFPFSAINHPVSYAYSCTNGIMQGNIFDCLTLSSDARDIARIPNSKMFPYAVQHIMAEIAYPEIYGDLSFHDALVRSGHTGQTEKIPTARENSTLHDTNLVDSIRNPIAYAIKTATGHYPEWIPGIGTIILIATIHISLYNIYKTPEINYDGTLIQTLGSGARAMKALRKNTSCTNKALKRLNNIVMHSIPKNLQKRFSGHR